MYNMKGFFLLIFLVLLSILYIPWDVALSKSPVDQLFEESREHINKRKDLTWGEKQKTKVELHDSLYGKTNNDNSICWLVCGGVILAIIIAVMTEAKKQVPPSVPKTKGPSTSDVFNALKKKHHSKDSKVISSSSSELTNNAETKKCPYCAEIIKKEAIVCRYCKRDLK